MTNTNPETGVRYGIISAQSLDGDLVDELWQYGTDVRWENAVAEIREAAIKEDFEDVTDREDAVERRIEELGNEWTDDEPIHEFKMDGVRGQTTWLGGAMMVWVFHSPFMGTYRLCSPCVPNCGNLDSPDPDGEECYDVPPEWRTLQV
jgi:hypothetical protein